MTIKNFIRAMQSNTKGFYIYKIDESVHTSYDPESDTELCGFYEKYADIPAEYLDAEIQDFFIDDAIYFYI